MIDQHLAKLKDLLVTATQFADVYTYFFDHLVEDPAFLDCGEQYESDFLKVVLATVGQGFLNKPVTLMEYLAVRLTDRPFVHGSCQFAGHLMTFFYFEDIALGLAAVVSVVRPHGKTHFIRFRGQR